MAGKTVKRRKNKERYIYGYEIETPLPFIHESLYVYKRIEDRKFQNPLSDKVDILISKQYLCKCYLCGQEHKFIPFDFRIVCTRGKGTNGYPAMYSKAHCDCEDSSGNKRVISAFQWKTLRVLEKYNVKYRVEMPAPNLFGADGKTPLRFDFVVYEDNEYKKPIFLIECQGPQHYKPIVYYGGEEGFEKQKINDEKKRKYAESVNLKLIEIPNKNNNIPEEKIEKILLDAGVIKEENKLEKSRFGF